MKKSLYFALASAVSALILSGCANQQPVEPIPEPEPVKLVDRSVAGVTVTYANESVANAVKVVGARLNSTERFPKLTFALLNMTQTKFPVEYQIQWIDKDGAPLQSSSAWLQTTLTGSAGKPVVSMGRSADAVSALITVRFPENVEIFVPTPDPVEQKKLEEEYIRNFYATQAPQS